jgi:hypothetical protein
MKVNASIHDYDRRLARYRRNIKLTRNGETTLRFLDHLGALGLSVGRVAKYASHLPPILRMIPVDLQDMTKTDVESVVAAINASQQRLD